MVILSFFLFLCSCKEEKKIAKKEEWAVVINFLSPDTSYYPALKHFPFPEELFFASPDSLFVNHGKLPTISDTNIIFYHKYEVNGENVCCRKDSLQVFSDTIRGKKYVFGVGEYITVFQVDTILQSLKPRKNVPAIPIWGIKLNHPYPPDKFLIEYEKLGADFVKLSEEFDEVTRQKWAEKDSLLLETIQFNNSSDRIITSVYKDMNEEEANTIIGYIVNNFPSVKDKETMQKNSEGTPMKIRRLIIDGFTITFTQTSETDYSFQATDYYETLKLILDKQQRYVFRDDIRVH